jgi:hypothetical protein
MQVLEFSKGSGSAVGLSLAADSADAFAQQLREVKAALLDWRAKHGDRCEMVMLTVASPRQHHPSIEALIEQVYHDETVLAPLLQSVSVQVALLNEQGRPDREYILGKSGKQQVDSKPWWRFW